MNVDNEDTSYWVHDVSYLTIPLSLLLILGDLTFGILTVKHHYVNFHRLLFWGEVQCSCKDFCLPYYHTKSVSLQCLI